MERILGEVVILERDIAGAPKTPCRLTEERRSTRAVGPEFADPFGVADPVGPIDAQCSGGESNPVDGPRVRYGECAEEADPGVDHDPAGGDAGQQGDLGVPVLDDETLVVLQREPPVGSMDDLLSRQRKAHGTALALEGESLPTDRLEQSERRRGGTRVDAMLGLRVGELLAVDDPGPFEVGPGDLALLVEIDGPQQCLALLAGEETSGVFVDGLGMQRCAGVGAVEGEPPVACFGVDGPAGCHECGDIGDRVEHAMAGAPSLGRECLVEVARAGRIDRDQREISGIPDPVLRPGGYHRPGCPGSFGGGLHLGGKAGRDVELIADPPESGDHLGIRRAADGLARHGADPNGTRPGQRVPALPGRGSSTQILPGSSATSLPFASVKSV